MAETSYKKRKMEEIFGSTTSGSEDYDDDGSSSKDSEHGDDDIDLADFEIQRREDLPPYKLPENPGEVTFNNNDKQRLKERTIKPNRMCCEDTLKTLGILEEVNDKLRVVGWEKMAYLPNVCDNKDTTIKFLSSLRVEFKENGQHAQYSITFQLFNRNFFMKYEEFARIFGFDIDGLSSIPNESVFNKQKFWTELGGKGRFLAGRSKGSEIKNKALRYIHRFMTYSVECRGESNSVVNRNELFYMWCMDKRKKVQTGKFFLRHLHDIARRDKGAILIGAFVNQVAVQLKLYPTKSNSTDEIHENLTLSTLERMDMIKKVRNKYVFVDDVNYDNANKERKRARKSEDELMQDVEYERVAETSIFYKGSHKKRLVRPFQSFTKLYLTFTYSNPNLIFCNLHAPNVQLEARSVYTLVLYVPSLRNASFTSVRQYSPSFLILLRDEVEPI